MNITYYIKIDLFLFFILQLIKFTFLDCIDNIINLGGKNFKYNHFSFNSEGDMIIDSHSYPSSNERRFFGLKANGNFYFNDSNKKQTPYYSLNINNFNSQKDVRIEGESSFINILYKNNVKELVCGVSKLSTFKNNDYNNYVELYNLKDKNYTYFNTKDVLGNLYSDTFSIIKNPNENDKYIFTYIVQNSTEYYLVYKIGYFLFDRRNKFITEKDISIKVSSRRIVTCFLTEKLKHICFFENEAKEKKTIVYNINFENNGVESIIYTPNNSNNDGEKQFMKGIHLKKEIGFFIYYKEKNSSFPTVSIYSCNSDLSMVPYSNFGDITFEKGTYKKDNVINDIVKLDENQVYYVSTDNSKHYFNIIVYSLYSDDKLMKIRYYLLEMWENHNHKIFTTLKINLYKQFLSIAYSHCPQTNCSSDGRDEHHSSLIIFGYPNSTESSLDVIPELYTKNKNLENDFCFYFENHTYIENNLFGLVVKGVSIINYPNDEIVLTNSSNFDVIQNNIIVLKDECITLSFPSHQNYEKKDYIIEIAYVLTEPDYNYNNIYLNDTETFGEQIENEGQYYLHHDYFGKNTQFTLKIGNKLTKNCEDYCSLCYFNNKSCIACMYDYDFKNNDKICYPKPTDTILITETIKPTEYIETTKPTEYIETNKPTEYIETNKPTEYIETNKPTEYIETNKATEYIETNKATEYIETNNPTEYIETNKPIEYIETNKPTENIKTNKPIEYIETNKPTEYIKTNKLTEYIETYIKTNKHTEYIETDKQSENIKNNTQCSQDIILKGECNSKITSEQIGDVYSYLKNNIKKDSNEIIKTENVIFQVSTLNEQKNSNDPDTSSIDIGDCEKILKEKVGLTEEEDLIIIKTDIKSDDLSKTYVQYDVYNPRNLNIIPLDECKSSTISISVPITLDESTISIYDSLQKSGYNLFNLNDSFYNDICSTYTTEDGTDLTLSDRKNLIYNNNGNVSMCQEGCTFQNYNISTKKSECSCTVQASKTVTDIDKLNFDENDIADQFFKTLNNSNFRVLKCYKLVFSKEGQQNNIGSFIMSGISFLFIVLMIIYIFNDHLKINTYIQNILRFKINSINFNKKKAESLKKENNNNELIKKKNINNKNNIKNNKNKNNNNNKKSKNDKNNKNNKNKNKKIENENKNKNKKNGIKNENKPKINRKGKYIRISMKQSSKKGNKKNNFPPKRKSVTNIYKDTSKKTLEEFISNKVKSKKDLIFLNEKIFHEKKNIIKNYKSPKKLDLSLNKINDLKTNKRNLNDEELNSLEYELALIIDKRTYFQYYFSLLKKKQLILFAFWPSNDYNLVVIKIALFLLSFSLYFTVNGFFFSDKTMNKINEDKGAFDIFFQIPQILYSSLISAVINIILKQLSLSERQILSIKQEKNFKEAQKKSNQTRKYIKIKLALFFILSLLLIFFFWYFISSFCAVYKNTQMILIKDTLISFGFSMVYPFGLNLFPGMLRIPALRAVKKNKKSLYKFSGFVALI